jgi:hypothetical protein
LVYNYSVVKHGKDFDVVNRAVDKAKEAELLEKFGLDGKDYVVLDTPIVINDMRMSNGGMQVSVGPLDPFSDIKSQFYYAMSKSSILGRSLSDSVADIVNQIYVRNTSGLQIAHDLPTAK